jgi:MFS family permease
MYSSLFSIFGVLVVAAAFFRYISNQKEDDGSSLVATPEFKAFQRNWLLVYYIVMGADWLQGPYVYALYEKYGYDKSLIGILFIAGFLSSLVFGTVAGAMADKFGRKRLCLFFGLTYSLSCLTKLHNNFQVLLLGRILSGIATSLLFSAFESWMLSEHMARKFPAELISQTFTLATFGNGIVAIAAGLIATVAAEKSSLGYVGPFVMALIPLFLASIIVGTTWNENYGDSTVEIIATFTNAFNAFRQDIRIPIIGLVQSLFEGAMYTFVFMWTPALTASMTDEEKSTLPFGLIFACYMVCIMIGSSLFNLMISKFRMSAEIIATWLLASATIALLVPVFVADINLLLGSFFVFEICCGIYFPCMGTLRGKYVPEATRSAVMNFFRIPLNALVVLVLIKVGSLNNSTVFLICSGWLAGAWVFQNWLVHNGHLFTPKNA